MQNSIRGHDCCQYSLCLPMKGWPGWVDQYGWLNTKITYPWTITRLSSNPVWCRVTLLMCAILLPLCCTAARAELVPHTMCLIPFYRACCPKSVVVLCCVTGIATIYAATFKSYWSLQQLLPGAKENTSTMQWHFKSLNVCALLCELFIIVCRDIK